MNRDVFLAILAMGSYNRGYGAKINGLSTLQGTALGGAEVVTDSGLELGDNRTQSTGFYSIAYNWNGETIISYRGTDGANDIW